MAKPPWAPLDLDMLSPGTYLACDPSMTALGLIWFTVHPSGVVVHGAEKLATAPTGDRKGWEDTFYRAELMEALIDALVDEWGVKEGTLAVHEAPPAGGGSLVRTESSILTGYAFRSVALEYKLTMDRTVTPQSHKKLLCGNHIASKTEHHKAIKELLPKITGSDKITNEAHRDALSIGLYAAWRKK